jgi:hypothetical protein
MGGRDFDPEMLPEEFRPKKDPRDFEFPELVHALPYVGPASRVLEFGMWAMKPRGPKLPLPYEGYVEESVAQGRNPVCRLCHDPDVRAVFERGNQASTLNQLSDTFDPDDDMVDRAALMRQFLEINK